MLSRIFRICGLVLLMVSFDGTAQLEARTGESGARQDTQTEEAVMAPEMETGGELFQAIRQRIEAGEIREAVTELDNAAEQTGESIDSADMHRARRLVTAAFLRINNRRDAWKEMDKLLSFELAHLNDPVSRNQVATTIRALWQIATQLDRLDETQMRCEEAIAALEPLTESGVANDERDELSKLRIIKAELLAESDNRESALQILRDDYDSLRELYFGDTNNQLATAMYLRAISNLMLLAEDAQQRDELFEEHQNILTAKMEAEPDNISFAVQYLAGIRFRLQEEIATDTAMARQRLAEAREVINRVLAANPSAERALQQYMVGIDNLDVLIRGQEKIRELKGTEARALKADAWVNGQPVSDEERIGSVVLLDFWAIWNAPSLQAMEFYRDLYDKYAEQGLKIIGVTRHYNIDWDFEQGKPRRATRPVSPETENQTLELFLEQQDIPWPTMVVNDVSSLFDDYAITGMPHAVLIDRQGNIREIRIGASAETTAQLDKTIQELLNEQ